MKYQGICLAVKDIQKSKEFYQKVMHQEIEMDLGANVSFQGGLALQAGFAEMVNIDPASMKPRPNNYELYFEVSEFEKAVAELKEAKVEFVHQEKEQEWGQRTIRFYDPDGIMIEVGERMDFVIMRYLKSGMTAEEVQKKTMVPMEFIAFCQGQMDK